jgi:hypothetical protein
VQQLKILEKLRAAAWGEPGGRIYHQVDSRSFWKAGPQLAAVGSRTNLI